MLQTSCQASRSIERVAEFRRRFFSDSKNPCELRSSCMYRGDGANENQSHFVFIRQSKRCRNDAAIGKKSSSKFFFALLVEFAFDDTRRERNRANRRESIRIAHHFARRSRRRGDRESQSCGPLAPAKARSDLRARRSNPVAGTLSVDVRPHTAHPGKPEGVDDADVDGARTRGPRSNPDLSWDHLRAVDAGSKRLCTGAVVSVAAVKGRASPSRGR